MKCRSVLSHSAVADSLHPMDCGLPGSSVHGDSPGKNTGVACHALLQGLFPAQGSNPGHPLQADSLLYEPPGKPWCETTSKMYSIVALIDLSNWILDLLKPQLVF